MATQLGRTQPYSLGFTIVELLVVIVVIGILAAITVVAYNGVQKSAIETSLKSDLRNGATQLELDRTEKGSYPTIADAVNNALLKSSPNNSLTYTPTADGFCLLASTTRAGGISYHIIGSSGTIEAGACPQTVATVTTIAGSSTPGYQNGTGSSVRFNFYNSLDNNYGWGIDTDNANNAYVTDHGNNVIRKITPAGVVSTYAGMVGDAGELITNNALTSSFNYPNDLHIFTRNGEQYMVVIESCVRLVKMDQPNAPTDIVNDASLAPHDGHMECPYVTNAGDVESWSGAFRDASSVVVDSNLVMYINEADSNKVRKTTYSTADNWWDMTYNLTAAGAYPSEAHFGIDLQNRVYGAVNNKIVRFTSAGVLSDVAGSSTAGFVNSTTASAARFNDPRGIDVDGNGNVYIADCGNHAVRKISPTGEVTTVAGSSTAGNLDGNGTSARFYCPADLAVTADGLTLYVVDLVTSGSNATGYIRKLNL